MLLLAWPQWRSSMAWEQKGGYCLCSARLLCCFEVKQRWWLDMGGAQKDESAKEVTNAPICLNLTLNHSDCRNQVSWRTGSWVKERLLGDYFWLLLWMLLPLECLCMYHNHGDHMFSRLAQGGNLNIYLGKYAHCRYGVQQRRFLDDQCTRCLMRQAIRKKLTCWTKAVQSTESLN